MSTIVAARSSLARHLSREHARSRAESGESVFSTPDIHSWNGWLRKHWTELTADPPAGLPALLSPRQERLLWERVLRDSPEASGMVDLAAAAHLASSAQSLAHAWRIPLSGPEYGLTDDSAAFERWYAGVSEICRAEGWAPACLLPELLEPFLDKATELHLAGFDNATPQQREFLGRFPNRLVPSPAVKAPNRCAAVFRDPVAEWEAAASWAGEALNGHPGANVAIVVAEFTRSRGLAAQAMDRAIPGRWRQSAGSPLASEPLVASALNLLEFLHASPPLSAIGANLLSPFIAGAASERFVRAGEDARLRKRRGPSLALREAIHADACPHFHRITAAWIDRQKSLPARQAPGAWARDFHSLLAAYGWIEEVTLTAREYAVHEAWRDALSEFASLDRVMGAITAAEARGVMENLIAESSFDDPSSAGAPVEIMPPEDAAGRRFTHVWFSGFHDQAWPHPVSAHPFLPVSLQRKHRVPQASTRLALERAEELTSQLLACGESIVIAHAQYDEDRQLRPSPLFPSMPSPEASQPPPVLSPVPLESLTDEHAPPLPATETHKGGVRIFQWQSSCPFHAFAEFRLHARPLEEPPTGFDPRDRGTLLHAALDNCWKELQNSARLTSITREEQSDLILRAVDRALTDKWTPANPLARQMQSIERERLARLLHEWLSCERVRREPFRIVEAERDREIEWAGLGIKIRVDRIDQLDDGSVVLIDYKSSDKGKSAWKGDRPAEPQLPLYAVTCGSPVAGVAFASVRPDDSGFDGHADRKGILDSGRAKPTPAPIDDWRDALTALAVGYLKGEAQVDPVNNACDICDLQRLCRIHESDGDEPDE